ncbi:LrgB family protein [Notoacmeibacter marinus]|uniref:LrgB family protein n=1 Tax=Notoacmeibacter marinus TaxID=1876515 RepID=UPI000DF23AB1|nr:LrgB family protein [Notoacmeibacter marinus]
MNPVETIWVYLAASPLLHLTITLAAYAVAEAVYERSGRVSLLNPVLLTILVLGGLLLLTGTSYETYFEGAQFVHFLLGPATVALAIPLHRQFNRVKQAAFPLLAAILSGAITAAVSAIGVTALLGAGRDIVATAAPKSVTTPIAMAVAERIGGLPSLTAVLVILTGIVGAALGPALLDLIRIRSDTARGVALGTAAGGIGTARALEDNDIQGAFSGLAMGLNALATAILVPIIWLLIG